MTQEVHAAAGTPFFTTKDHGQGLGLFLARSVFARYGGSLNFSARQPEGTSAKIILPFSKLGLIL